MTERWTTDLSGSLTIDRAPDEVFDFVADERNRYDPRIRGAEKLTDGPIGVGTRFRIESVAAGRSVALTVEITTHDRPQVLQTTTRAPGDGDRQHAPLRPRG